jgi:hypothetical protein
MCADLVSEMDRPFGVYEFEDGKPHWRKERFAAPGTACFFAPRTRIGFKHSR